MPVVLLSIQNGVQSTKKKPDRSWRNTSELPTRLPLIAALGGPGDGLSCYACLTSTRRKGPAAARCRP